MTDAVHVLPTAPRLARDSAVRLLREALGDAEHGIATDVIIISKHADGAWYHRANPTLGVRERIGALEIIKTEIVLQNLKE